jgi:hypothetical protein
VPCDDTHLASYIEKLIGSTYTDDENKQRDELVKSHTDLEKQLQPPAFEIAQINRLSGINPGSQDRERRNIDLEADRAILNLQSAGEIQSRRNSSWEEFPRRHSAIAQSFGVNKSISGSQNWVQRSFPFSHFSEQANRDFPGTWGAREIQSQRNSSWECYIKRRSLELNFIINGEYVSFNRY